MVTGIKLGSDVRKTNILPTILSFSPLPTLVFFPERSEKEDTQQGALRGKMGDYGLG